jgi:hypothetical protein
MGDDEKRSHEEVEPKKEKSAWFYPFVGEVWKGEAGVPVSGKFAPDDIMDGRPAGEWRTRYPKDLHELIQWEAVYLAGLGLGLLVLAAVFWMVCKGFLSSFFPSMDPTVGSILGKGALAFAGGALGGTLFGLKWLYHSVAKGLWSIDRRLWRLFTPWNSGVLAIAFVALVNADFLRILNKSVLDQPSGVFGVSFLVGYFSDMTIGKLNELAQVLFGLHTHGRKVGEQKAGQTHKAPNESHPGEL